jgi:Serine dehydrogenase proteinase
VPTWGQLLQELNVLLVADQSAPPAPGGPSAFDHLRRKYMRELHERTGRAVLVYATAWLEARQGLDSQMLSISLGDMAGYMEAVSNVDEREVDLFLTSPGGSPEAADAIVQYLRSRFDHIRVVVPIAAMSAATMMALAADEILMGAHSQLGPIDPQLTISTPEGPRTAPAQAILDQFELAKEQCQDTKNIAAWLPILRLYGPGLLAQCTHSRELAESFATRNLAQYMFKGDEPKAKATAAWFADFREFRSHGRRVNREDARAQGLNVTNLEDDHGLQDAVLSVHHAYSLTLGNSAAVKIIESHTGRCWVQAATVVPSIQLLPAGRPAVAPAPAPALPQPNLGGQQRPNRRARRAGR